MKAPILHRQETLPPPDHPLAEKFQQLRECNHTRNPERCLGNTNFGISVMKVYTYSDARQRLAEELNIARNEETDLIPP